MFGILTTDIFSTKLDLSGALCRFGTHGDRLGFYLEVLSSSTALHAFGPLQPGLPSQLGFPGLLRC